MPTNSLEDKILVIISSELEKKLLDIHQQLERLLKRKDEKCFHQKRKRIKLKLINQLMEKNFCT